MKRICTLLLAAGMLFGAATGASAIDFNAKGQWLMGFSEGKGSPVDTFRDSKGVKTKAGTGDLLVTLQVQIPSSVNDQAKQAIRDFARAMGETNPRASILGRE